MKYALKPDEYIKFESDLVYHPDDDPDLVPTVRTEYDFKTEMDLYEDELKFLKGKIDLIPELTNQYLKVTEYQHTQTFKTEDDLITYKTSMQEEFKKLQDTLQSCYEGSDMTDEVILEEGETLLKSESDIDGNIVLKMEASSGDSVAGNFFGKLWHYVKKFFKWVFSKLGALLRKIESFFSGGVKVLNNLKEQIQELEHELNENVTEYATELSYYLNVLNKSDRAHYTANVDDAIESSNGGLNDWIAKLDKALESAVGRYRTTPDLLEKEVVAIANERYENKYLKNNDIVSRSETTTLRYANPKSLTFDKAFDKGTYFNIGVSGSKAILLYTKYGLSSKIVKFDVIAKNNEINNLRPEELKEALYSICEMGVDFLSVYSRKKFKELSKTTQEQEKVLLSTVKSTENMLYDVLKTIEDMSSRNAIEKPFKTIYKDMVDNTTQSARGIVSTTLALGQQVNAMIKAIKSGMKRLS